MITPLAALALFTAGPARRMSSPGPDLRVEYFGTDTGWAVRGSDEVLLCVVRNTGAAPLPAGAVRLRCYALAGLDYTSGDTIPAVPPLEPGGAAAFRWRFAASGGTRTAAVVMQNAAAGRPGTAPLLPIPSDGPRAVLCTAPEVASAPELGSLPVAPAKPPITLLGSDTAAISNGMVALRAVRAGGQQPILLLACATGGAWATVATGSLPISVQTAEPGMHPWRQPFRWERTETAGTPVSATLTLLGTVGRQWRASLAITAVQGSSALRCELRLVATSAATITGARLPALVARPLDDGGRADGAAHLLAADANALPDGAAAAALFRSGVTFGEAWSGSPPFQGAAWSALPGAGSAGVLGAEVAAETPADAAPGTAIIIPFRLFAVTQSATVKDALKFAGP